MSRHAGFFKEGGGWADVDTNKMEDERSKLFADLAKHISKELESHGFPSNFLLCPTVSAKSSYHSCLALEVGGLTEFWATMIMIIDNMSFQVPEDYREEFSDGFITFVKATADKCFPTIEFGERYE